MNMFKRSATGLFASRSVAGHLLRGGAGILLMAWAIRHQDNMGAALVAALGALAAFRGCPVCWTIGLVETVAQRLRRHL
jgi:hypothetical protein